MSTEPEEQARRRAEGAKLDAYLAHGIEIVGPHLPDHVTATFGPDWDLDWLLPRLIGRDHVRYMLHQGKLVGVLTQPYDQIQDLAGCAQKLGELHRAGFEVDLCMHCSSYYPGRTLALIHYRPADNPPELHLPHGF